MSHLTPTRTVVYAENLIAMPKAPRPPPAPAPRPVKRDHASFVTKLGRAKRSLLNWKEKGCPMVSREERKRRLSICQGCPYWNEKGNFLFGECTAPGCGCTRIKMALATERCPLTPPKWDRVLD